MSKWFLISISFLWVGPTMAQETYEVETPEGVVNAARTTVDEFPQTVADIEESVLEAIDANVLLGPAFVREFVEGVSDPNLKDYDEAFKRWQDAAAIGETEIANGTVIDLFGSILGNALVTDFEMKWVKVVDDYGTEYAVKGRRTEVFAYPFSTVGKRVDRGEHDFMYGVYHAIRQALESGEYLEETSEDDYP